MDVSQPVGIGTDFLGYRIEELLGRGGMGVVYRAYDLRLKRPVALKLVAPALARDDRFRERFARESELVMSLEHPNVVPIYDAGDVDGRVYLAMRLVDGRDLGSLLRVEGALEPARAIGICSQIAAALDAAHARGLVHRDVKPSNVLLDSSDHVYLADFGLTRRLDDEEGAAGEDATVGTPAYLAPEQLDGGPVGEPADVYALGCVLYECLTGEPVFVRSSRLAVAWAHLEEEPPKPSRLRTELPEAVDAVVARALAKEPERRYPSCGALVAAAGAALGLGATRTSNRRRLLFAAAAGLVVASAVAAAVSTFVHGGPGRAARPLLAGPDTLARIDPATSKVSRVFHVGDDPVVTAGGDYTVWVYSRGSESITQVNAVTNRIVETTPVSLPAKCCSLFTGPVLAADASGAWFIDGGVAGRKAQLVHIPVGHAGERVYPLPVIPTGVAVARTGDSVWVVGHDSRHDEVLRIDPFTGAVTGTLRRRRSTGIDSIAFGYGHVWVLSSARATLYRLDPSLNGVTRSLVLSHSRAMRPEIMPRGGDIWVREADGTTDWIHPSRLLVYNSEPSSGQGEDRGQLGSLWWYDSATGRLSRQQVANGPIRTIPVTRPTPGGRGPCLTSIAIVPPSIWMAVAPRGHSSCER